MRYRFRRSWRNGTTGIVLHPHELIERLAALVPRPRTHLLTYAPITRFARDGSPLRDLGTGGGLEKRGGAGC